LKLRAEQRGRIDAASRDLGRPLVAKAFDAFDRQRRIKRHVDPHRLAHERRVIATARIHRPHGCLADSFADRAAVVGRPRLSAAVALEHRVDIAKRAVGE
jgi:hypothetical protein